MPGRVILESSACRPHTYTVLMLLLWPAREAQAARNSVHAGRLAVVQVLFALPAAEDVVQRVDCRLVDHGVQGTLFLAGSHLCFSSLAPLAATAAAVAPGGGFSLKRNSLFAAGSGAHPNVTLVAPLSKVRSMAQGFAKRSKSLVFTLDDNSQVWRPGLAPLTRCYATACLTATPTW